MKTIKKISVLTAILLIFCGFTFSSELYDGNQKKVTNKIGQYLNIPDFMKKEQISGSVLVEVTVTKEGKLIVNEIFGHPSMQEYVIAQISKIKMHPTKDMIGKTFQYKINFKTL
ncbi:MAG: hypothetical protein ABIJ97_11140 [Bacteroidota bacterium]